MTSADPLARLGVHLRELWRARLVLPVALLAALAAAILPALGSGEIGGRTGGAADTQILIDGGGQGLLTTAAGITNYNSLNGAALLVGNVMTSDPGVLAIARAAHLPPRAIRFSDPQNQTPGRRQVPAGSHAPYALTVAASPSVPLLDVYATGPSGSGAVRLANAAVAGLQDFLHTRAAASLRLRVTQLGSGRRIAAPAPSRFGLVARFLVVLVLAAEAALRLARRRSRRRGGHASPPVSRPLLG